MGSSQEPIFREQRRLFPVIPQESLLVATGDLDRDGDQDLVLSTGGGYTASDSPTLPLLRNDGVAGFLDVTATLPVMPLLRADVALVDLDGNGDLDALFAGGDAALLRNDDTGLLEASEQLQFAMVLPNDPSLVGLTLFAQAGVGAPPRLTNVELLTIASLDP